MSNPCSGTMVTTTSKPWSQARRRSSSGRRTLWPCSQRPGVVSGPLLTGGSTSTKVPISCRLASAYAPPPDGKP